MYIARNPFDNPDIIYPLTKKMQEVQTFDKKRKRIFFRWFLSSIDDKKKRSKLCAEKKTQNPKQDRCK